MTLSRYCKGQSTMPDSETLSTLKSRLVTNKDGQPLPTEMNLTAIFQCEEVFGKLRFNEVTKETSIVGSQFEGLPPDTVAFIVTCWLQSHFGMHKASVHLVENTLLAVARTTGRFNPVREYLESIKWDGTPRIDTWLLDYCSARTELEDGTDVKPYLRQVSARWLISAVARGIRPGCKVDTCLILQGKQGIKKSSLLETLGGQWFVDGVGGCLGDKDSKMAASAGWIVEIAELSAMTRSQVEQIKSYFSTRTDSYRPPYGRTIVKIPRTCVFAGSTNARGFLLDEEHRRFWVVEVGSIHDEHVARDRDQLWAEAVVRYQAGERWWLTADEQELATRVAQTHEEESDLGESILSWWQDLDDAGREFIAFHQIATKCLKLEEIEIPKYSRAIKRTMVQLGFERVRGKYLASRVRGYRPTKRTFELLMARVFQRTAREGDQLVSN